MASRRRTCTRAAERIVVAGLMAIVLPREGAAQPVTVPPVDVRMRPELALPWVHVPMRGTTHFDLPFAPHVDSSVTDEPTCWPHRGMTVIGTAAGGAVAGWVFFTVFQFRRVLGPETRELLLIGGALVGGVVGWLDPEPVSMPRRCHDAASS